MSLLEKTHTLLEKAHMSRLEKTHTLLEKAHMSRLEKTHTRLKNLEATGGIEDSANIQLKESNHLSLS